MLTDIAVNNPFSIPRELPNPYLVQNTENIELTSNMAPVEQPQNIPAPTADSLQFQVKLWSGVKKNINEFVEGVQESANLFKKVLKMPFEQLTATKPILLQRKRPYYITAGSNVKKIHILPAPVHKKKIIKKPARKIPKNKNTYSEEHLHYDDKGNLMPELTGKHVGYDSDGPKNYNVFKDKFLKQIEQKEEEKVEAAMDSFYDSKGEIEFMDDRPYTHNNGWSPIEPFKKSEKPKKYIPTEKPKEASKLHTNVMSFPIESQHMNVLMEESSSNNNNFIKSNDKLPTERPNYPDYFFEIQTTMPPPPRPFQKKKPIKTQDMEESVRSLVIVKPATRYVSTTTYAPTTTRKSRRANTGVGTSDWKIQSNRGNIKFADKVTNENL